MLLSLAYQMAERLPGMVQVGWSNHALLCAKTKQYRQGVTIRKKADPNADTSSASQILQPVAEVNSALTTGMILEDIFDKSVV